MCFYTDYSSYQLSRDRTYEVAFWGDVEKTSDLVPYENYCQNVGLTYEYVVTYSNIVFTSITKNVRRKYHMDKQEKVVSKLL